MVEFKIRLIKERDELDDKINKLHDFLFSQNFYVLDKEQKILLRKISGKAHDFSRGMKAPQCFF